MLGRAFVAVAIAECPAEFLGGRRGSDSMTRIGAEQVRIRTLQCPAASLTSARVLPATAWLMNVWRQW